MKKFLLAGLMVVAMAGVVRADEPINAPAVVETVFDRYVVNPVQFVVGGAWGISNFLFKVGKAPVDKAFELVGAVIGREPNTPSF